MEMPGDGTWTGGAEVSQKFVVCTFRMRRCEHAHGKYNEIEILYMVWSRGVSGTCLSSLSGLLKLSHPLRPWRYFSILVEISMYPGAPH
jgi:hypothetical protein